MQPSELPLFHQISADGLADMRAQGFLTERRYRTGEWILHAGDPVSAMGILLCGAVRIESLDLWGGRAVLSLLEAGQVFAESYTLCREPLMVDAVCAKDADILFLHGAAALDDRNRSAPWYLPLLRNLMLLSARKNLTLSERIFCTSAKSVRERLMTYFSRQAVRAGGSTFTIPFDRQELADYLNLDRSAVSRELSRMQREGILQFRKNRFTIHRDDHDLPDS